MKTQAERQKAVRERRLAAGNQRRLNMWLSNEAYEALSALARQQGITRMQALDRLLLAQGAPEDVSQSPLSHLLAEMPAEGPAEVPTADKTPAPVAPPAAVPPPASSGRKKAGGTKSRPKKKVPPQIQIDLFAAITPVAPPATVEQPLGIQGSFWDDL